MWLALVLVACSAALAPSVAAQEERPEIMPGERKVTGKKDLGPRALGLLRLTASGKASLVPIAIMINGRFWDAAVYKADPIPMSLDAGTVYEVERSGSSLGLFTVSAALHSNAANAQSPWLATGAWLPAGKEAPNQPLKAETVPVGIDTSDAPPRLTRNPQKEAPPANTAPASAPSAGPTSGDEPPRLTKPAPKEEAPASTTTSSPQAGSAGSTQAGSGQSAPGSTTPAGESKSAEAKSADHPKEPTGSSDTNSGATDANRPRLRRGKPTDNLPEEEIPGYSKPGAEPAAKAGKTAETMPAPEPVQLIPAISDAGGPQPRAFTFEWLKDEEAERRQQMTALARQELGAYLNAQTKARILAPAAASRAQRPGATKKLPEPILENVRMLTYDLWNANQPIMVFSAEAHLPPPPAGAQGGFEADLTYSMVLVAYPDIYGNLRRLYARVTDKYHLDITPRLELIDAVDADGDGRGELLFRETSDAGSGWVIYRATADTLWKMFDSLNPE